jgi:hypothetical protein
LLDLLALHYRDQAVQATGRDDLALLAQAGAGGRRGLGQALSGFELVRQAQSAILGNAAPELAVVALLGRLRAPAVTSS